MKCCLRFKTGFCLSLLFFLSSIVCIYNVQAQTESKIDSLLSLLKENKADTNRVIQLLDLAKLYDFTNPEKIPALLDEALKLSQKLGFKRGQARTMGNLAVQNIIEGKSKESLEYVLKALKMAKEIEDKPLIAKSLNFLAEHHTIAGNISLAIEYRLKALKIAEEIQDKESLSNIHNGIGVLYSMQGNHDLAEVHLLKSRDFLEDDNPGEISNIYNNLADLYLRRQANHPDSIQRAMEYIDKALQIAQENEQKARYAGFLITKGEVYILKKDYQTAIDTLLESLRLNQEIEAAYQYAYIYNKVAEVYLAQEELGKAEKYYSDALESSVGEVEVTIDTYRGLMEVHKKKGDADRAFEFQEKYYVFRDSLFNSGNHAQTEALMLTYDLEKKNDQIALLEKDQHLQTARNQRTTMFLVLALLLVTGVILFAIYQRRLQQKQKKTNQELQEKNEEVAQQAEELQQQAEELAAQRDSLEQSYENVELLSGIGKAIISSLDVGQIIDITYEKVNELMDATVFMIGVYHPENDSLEFPVVKEKGETLPHLSYQLSEKDRPAVLCFRDEKELIMNDVMTDYPKYFDGKILPPVKSGEITNSVLYLPLQTKEKTMGVISVQSFQKDAYTGYQINMLRNLAIYSAIAVENAEMLAQLNQEKGKLSESTAQLEELLEESQTQKEVLETRNEEMKALQSTKDLMISAVNHDLRNPLNPILNYSSPTYPEPDKDKRLNMINERAKMMFSLINDIMDVYRADKLSLQPQTANPFRAVEEAIQAIQEGKSEVPEIINEVPEESKAIFEYKYIERVFENLLSNAVKYSESKAEGGKVRFYQEIVAGEEGEEFLKISVEDNGVGIPKDKFEEIFRPFSNPNARDIGAAKSVGIGLTFCKTIVEAHGSQLEIVSEVGKGTTFSFLLPRAVESSGASGEDRQEGSEMIQLTEEEKSQMSEIIAELEQYELYEMELQDALDKIDPNGNERLASWQKALQFAKDEDDEDRFKALLG